ncbi:major facilitator superfamily domain-containing protein [Xylogone sp. PMI_703]|nr:major facilitator superfamily domain-containing protein [Xylogone sp. PMI_703]
MEQSKEPHGLLQVHRDDTQGNSVGQLSSENHASVPVTESKTTDTFAGPTDGSTKVRDISTFKWLLTLAAIYTTGLLYGLDTTVAADVQGTILEKLGEPEKLAWIGVGFPLGSVAVILSLGKAYGVLNMKWLYLANVVLFEVGSAICGASPTMNALVAGAGGAGLFLGGLNILSSMTTEYERPIYMSGTGVSWGLGTILGPVIGGAFAGSSATWRWAFYLNLVIFAVTSPIFVFIIPSLDPQPGRRLTERLDAIDWVGTVLNAAIYASWVLALTFGGAQWAWGDGRTIACFVVCGVLIGLFGLQQGFKLSTTSTQRIFPARFLLSRSLLLQYFATSCTATALFIPVYYIPLFFQFTKSDGALEAAVRLLPFITVTIFCIMLNGALMPKLGFYQPWFILSGALILTGGALMYTVDANTSPGRVYGYSVLIAMGTGLSAQASYSVAPVKAAMDSRYGPQMIPDAIGFINMAQIGSVVHALAISGTVFQNLAFRYLKTSLAGQGFTDAQLHSAIAGTQSQLLAGASKEVKELALHAILKAMDRVYILIIVAGAVCLIVSLGMRTERLFMKASVGGA